MDSSDSSLPAVRNGTPTVAQADALRLQFSDLSSDYYMLCGEFDKEDLMKQYASKQISWYGLEKRCLELRTLVRSFRSDIGGDSATKAGAEYAALRSKFDQTRDELTALRIQLEGHSGHLYKAKNTKFQHIGNQTNTSRPSQGATTPTSKKKPKRTRVNDVREQNEHQPVTTRKQMQKASLKRSEVKTPIKTEDKTSSFFLSELPMSQNKRLASSRNTTRPNVSQPHFNAPTSTLPLSQGHYLRLQQRLVGVEKEKASLKISLKNLNNANEALRQSLSHQKMRNESNEVEILRVKAKLQDYREFVDDLASVVNQHDSSILQAHEKVAGGRKIIKLPRGTKLSINCGARKLKVRELDEELVEDENRWWVERHANREGNPDSDAGLSDEDFQPKKRRKSGHNKSACI